MNALLNFASRPAPGDADADADANDEIDWHARLSGPHGESERLRLDQHLQALEAELGARARAVNRPGEQQDLAAALGAVDAARQVLSRLRLSGRPSVDGPLFDVSFFSTGARP
jgi:hypothetical protein